MYDRPIVRYLCNDPRFPEILHDRPRLQIANLHDI